MTEVTNILQWEQTTKSSLKLSFLNHFGGAQNTISILKRKRKKSEPGPINHWYFMHYGRTD